MASQIVAQHLPVAVWQRGKAAHDVEESGFPRQVVDLHQARKAADFAEDIANNIDRMRGRLIHNLIKRRRRLGHSACPV
jgi:hypothetical protein